MTIDVNNEAKASKARELDTFLNGTSLFADDLILTERKTRALNQLTTRLICSAEPPDRNSVLKSLVTIKECRSTLAKMEKELKLAQKQHENVVLAMLETEELDNFSHDGKLFYPSSTTRYNVKDRKLVEQFIMEQGPDGLQLLGNTLNAEYIRNHAEANANADDGSAEPTVPPGIGSFTQTSLNVRTKS